MSTTTMTRFLQDDSVEDLFDQTARSRQAFGLVIAAAAATSIGAAAVWFPRLAKLATAPVLAGSLAFATGVMLYVSLVDIYTKAVDGFTEAGIDDDRAFIYATLSFFAGIFVMKLLDMFIHAIMHWANPCSEEDEKDALLKGMEAMVARNAAIAKAEQDVAAAIEEDNEEIAAAENEEGITTENDGNINNNNNKKNQDVESTEIKKPSVGTASNSSECEAGCCIQNKMLLESEEQQKELFTMGAATACAIALHNFPEGLVTFVSYVSDPGVGVALAVGIAIHNIPEGLCVAMPLYYATGNKRNAFLWGCLSGMSEPFGALVGWLIIGDTFSGRTYGILFGLVGGIMVYICVDELLPMAYQFDPKGQVVTWSLVTGMALIALSLVLFSI